ncbi:MAG: hypothetical protein LBU23_01090 [Planctomycetota bacterium]|jgi:hypothetical protein|nr:hypothetical protein [Planctomycetota bacterium]
MDSYWVLGPARTLTRPPVILADLGVSGVAGTAGLALAAASSPGRLIGATLSAGGGARDGTLADAATAGAAAGVNGGGGGGGGEGWLRQGRPGSARRRRQRRRIRPIVQKRRRQGRHIAEIEGVPSGGRTGSDCQGKQEQD